MMRERRRLARRYATALGWLAEERNLLDEVERDLELVQSLLDGSEEFGYLLRNEQIAVSERCAFLERVLKDEVQPLTLDFLYLIIRKHRARYLEDIIDAYVEYANERRGILVVRVTTAKELDDMLLETLREGLGKALDAKVRVRSSVDPSLLGGVIVRVGDLLIDGSALTRLNQLGRTLKSAQLN